MFGAAEEMKISQVETVRQSILGRILAYGAVFISIHPVISTRTRPIRLVRSLRFERPLSFQPPAIRNRRD
jgi:hypothetical protein